MTFDALISDGWAEHERDPSGVAGRLEAGVGQVADAAQAARFVALVNHAVGSEAGDWRRAARLGAAAVGRVAASADLAPALVSLAVARFMAGEAAEALASERRALELAGAVEAAALVACSRLLLAEALVGAERWDEGLARFAAGLDLAAGLPAGAGSARTLAVAANNVTGALLERPGRPADLDPLLERGALAARRFWLEAGDWRNDERADYLLALVYNAAGRPVEGAACARRGLETIGANGAEPVDRAFLQAALAAAARALGQPDEQARALAEAERVRAGLDDPALKGWLGAEIEKGR